TIAFVDAAGFPEPSTKSAAALLQAWGQERPLVLVVGEDEAALAKSFRNLEKVVVVQPSELEVTAVVWARSLLVSQAALEAVQMRAGKNDKAGKSEKQEASA
ncbi:MAG: 50S ribosomal protein L4, partial [Acidobacteriota bacterium]